MMMVITAMRMVCEGAAMRAMVVDQGELGASRRHCIFFLFLKKSIIKFCWFDALHACILTYLFVILVPGAL